MVQWLRIHYQCKGQGFDPWSRKIPHAMGQLSSCAAAAQPTLWSLCSESEVHTLQLENIPPPRCNLRKATCSNEDPAHPKINNFFVKERKQILTPGEIKKFCRKERNCNIYGSVV